MVSVPLRVAALILPLAFVAGCFTNDPGEGDDSTRPTALDPRWSIVDSTLLPSTGSERSAFEPSVVADADGHVVATAAKGISSGGAPEASWLWVRDGPGTEWRVVPPLAGTRMSNLPFGAEGHVALAPDGTFYYIDLTLAGVTVMASTDGGATWALRNANTYLVGGGDREWVAAGPGESVYVSWNQIPSGVWIAASSDGGRTFPVQTNIPGTSIPGDMVGGPGWSVSGVPSVTAEGDVVLVRGEPQGPGFYRSTDGARTFEHTLAWTSDEGVQPVPTHVVEGPDGTIYVLVTESVNGTWTARYALLRPGASDFEGPFTVRANGTIVYPWPTVTPDGALAVLLYESPGRAGSADDTDAPWYAVLYIIADSTRPDDAERHIMSKAPVRNGVLCTGGATGGCPQGGRALGDYLGLHAAADGSLHAVWADAEQEPGKTRVAHARLEPPSPTNSAETPV